MPVGPPFAPFEVWESPSIEAQLDSGSRIRKANSEHHRRVWSQKPEARSLEMIPLDRDRPRPGFCLLPQNRQSPRLD